MWCVLSGFKCLSERLLRYWRICLCRMLPVQSEHCEAETFRASCPVSTVIVVRRALYGRMRLGRCVLRDYGYVGCFADVVAHMDVICSGRRTCSIRIPDAMLDRANPCPKDFKTYLLISYDCVPGVLTTRYDYVVVKLLVAYLPTALARKVMQSVSSVRLSVPLFFTLSYERTDLWTCVCVSLWVMTIPRLGFIGQGQKSTRSVCPLSSIEGSFSSCCMR